MNMNFFIRAKTGTIFFKTVFLVLVFVSLFSAESLAQKTNGGKTSTAKLPKITQVDEIKLKNLLKPNGKPLLINFWATWCDPCREEFPDLVKIENDYRGKIDVVTISLDDVMEINTTVSKFLTEMKAETQNFLLVTEDESAVISKISKEWSGGLPFTVFYNDKGGIEYFRQGKFKVPELREKIDKSIPAKVE